jgi:hypothetical protein
MGWCKGWQNIREKMSYRPLDKENFLVESSQREWQWELIRK